MVNTGNASVDALAEMNISGNITPANWYKTILRDNGKPYLLAICILSEIVYWYRPVEVRDEHSGMVVGYRKKFREDMLQKSYSDFAEQFGESKRSVKAAIDRLEEIGVIRRVFMNRTLNNGIVVNNIMYVDLCIEALYAYDKLMTIIGRTIKDGDVISIVRKYLVSGIMIDDEYEDSIVGTPQGGNLSPLLANIMLNELDKEMEKRGLNFVRYADDCIIMVGSEMSANRVMRNISRFIEEKLGLKVNMTKSKVDRPQGLKYLGFGFYFDPRAHQFKAKPHAKSVVKFKKRMKELTCRSWGVSNGYKVEKLNQLIRGWINYFKIGSMKALCRELDMRIRYRLRMCIWKHWKTPQNRIKNLMKLGVDKDTAWITAYTGKRIAYVCQRRVMNFAINKERLTRFGLVSMLDYYTERCVTC